LSMPPRFSPFYPPILRPSPSSFSLSAPPLSSPSSTHSTRSPRFLAPPHPPTILRLSFPSSAHPTPLLPVLLRPSSPSPAHPLPLLPVVLPSSAPPRHPSSTLRPFCQPPPSTTPCTSFAYLTLRIDQRLSLQAELQARTSW